MKKSNIILVILLAGLYLIPAIVWGFYKVSSKGDYYTAFGNDVRFIQIDNPGLTKEDIVINTRQVPENPGFKMNNSTFDASYLYYKGSRKYLPQVEKVNNTLIIGKATGVPSSEKLKLLIRINNLEEITLNGETVFWRR